MLNAEIKKAISVKLGGTLENADVLFFDLNGSYVKNVDFTFSPSFSDQLSEQEKIAASNAEFIYDSYE